MPRSVDENIQTEISQIIGFNPSEDICSFKIQDFNEEKGLYLIHYNVDDVCQTNKNSQIQELRGTVVDINEKKIVCSSFGYVSTIVENDASIIDAFVKGTAELVDTDGRTHSLKEKDESYQSFQVDNDNHLDIFPLYEGTMIRVWKHNGTLMASTHKKIDCVNSHWGNSKKFRKLVEEYTMGYNLEEETPEGMTHYFILLDENLLVTSKISLGTRKGALIYAGSRNSENGNSEASWELHKKLSLPSMKDFGAEENSTKTFFGPHSISSVEEMNKILNQGFYDYPAFEQSSPWCLGEGMVLAFNLKGKRRHIRIIPTSFKRRIDVVANDPNVLHRSYVLLNAAFFNKSEDDIYLRDYPATTIFSSETLKGLTGPIIGTIPEGKIYTETELTDKTTPSVYEKRFRNAIVWYAMSLALPHQLTAFRTAEYVLKERKEVAKILCDNYDKFCTGDFSDFTIKNDVSTGKHIQHRLIEAEKFAARISQKGTPREILRKNTLNNVRNGIMRDTGEWSFKIARFLIPKRYEALAEIF